jgi:hypothetical protein
LDDLSLHQAVEALQSILTPLTVGEFAEKIGKVSVYIGSIEKSWKGYSSSLESAAKQTDPEKRENALDLGIRSFKTSAQNSARFAKMNLDQAMSQALKTLVRKPMKTNKVDEKRKIDALLRWFDQVPDPTGQMINHFKATSNPLDKYLVAGPWGHEYLRKRGINTEAFDREICQALECGDSAASRLVLSYGSLNRAIEEVEGAALRSLDAYSPR